MGIENDIKLNEILNFDNSVLDNIVIRFNKPSKDIGFDPINDFLTDRKKLIDSNLWNYKNNNRIFKLNDIVIGFVRLNTNKDHWLLFDIAKIVKVIDNVKEGVGYESETISKYKNFLGRVIVYYHSTASYPHQLIKKAPDVIDIINEISVVKILPEIYTISDDFPGYKYINLSWPELEKVMEKDAWIAALQNQKGIYLIIDTNKGKYYVGQASGKGGFLQRWKDYVKTGDGGDVDLIKLGFDYIKKYFRYTILETIDDNDIEFITDREHWWMNVLQTRKFGNYNNN